MGIAVNKTADSVGGIGPKPGQIQSTVAVDHPLPDAAAGIWFTDPPYYDAIPYSDLSDFFLVWLKRTLPDHPLLRDPFDPDNSLSPKDREAVQDETKECNGRVKDRAFFEDTMGGAFAEGCRVLSEDGERVWEVVGAPRSKTSSALRRRRRATAWPGFWKKTPA